MKKTVIYLINFIYTYYFFKNNAMQYSSNVLNRYKENTANVKHIINEFSLPIFLNRFYLNRKGLIANSKIVKFNKNLWVNNPQRFCSDQYNEYEYYRIILLVNNIRSVFLFNSNYIKNNSIITPTETAILSVLSNSVGLYTINM